MATLSNDGQKLLKGWLSDHERTVSWFGRMIGVSKTTVHSWLSGKSRPLHPQRLLIEALTGIDPLAWFTAKESREYIRSAKRIESFQRNNK